MRPYLISFVSVAVALTACGDGTTESGDNVAVDVEAQDVSLVDVSTEDTLACWATVG